MSAKDLKERIRPLKAKSEERPPREPFVSRAMVSFGIREKIEGELQPYIDTLLETIPELVQHRRFYEGAWVVGVSADLPQGKRFGRPYLAYTRLDFAIEVESDLDNVTVTCRSTAFNRDFETVRTTVVCDEAEWDELRGFIERSCLQFAERFFTESSRSTTRTNN